MKIAGCSSVDLGLFQEKIPGRVGTPLIFFYLGGGRKTYFFSGGCCQISIELIVVVGIFTISVY